MSTKSWIAASIALFPGADILLKALPVPVDYALLVKLPAALFCMMLGYVIATRRVRSVPVAYCVAGILFMFLYVIAAKLLLHSNPVYYRPGDNSLIGLWVSENGRNLMAQRGWSRAALEDDFAPGEWNLIYSQGSQLASAIVLAVFYALGLGGITMGFGMFLKKKN